MSGLPLGLWEIVYVMVLGSLLGVGGGNGFIPMIQNHFIATGKLDASLFSWAYALGTLTPGPKVGFVAGVGYYLRGYTGAVVAVVSIVVITAIASGFVSVSMSRLSPIMKRISLPSAFVIGGLIIGTGWGLAAPLHPSLLEGAAMAGVVYLIGWRDFDPVWVVLAALALGVLLSL